MDNDNTNVSPSSDIPLGAGIDIVKNDGDIDEIEYESYNDDILGSGADTPQDQIKKLRERYKEAVREKQAYLDGWQRLKAEFANYKKREEDARTEFMKFAREGLITDLLPTLESFHMAFANKSAWEKVDPSWRKGVEYIHTNLVQALGSHGLVALDPTGQKFDPQVHTSIGTVPTDDPALDHHIATVTQLGYRLHDRVIKSPQVHVYELKK